MKESERTQTKRLIIVIFTTLAILGATLPIIPVKATFPYDVGGGSNNYSKIQDAVDDWPLYGTNAITVYPNGGSGPNGEYQEHVYIDRSKFVSPSNNLVIEAKPGATLDGIGYTLDYGFEINGTPCVMIKGFTIRHYKEAGIYIHRDNSVMQRAVGNTIWKNTIEDNRGFGIHMGASDFNSIQKNTIQNNEKHGIFIDDGAKNKIHKQNSVLGNKWTGIELHIAPDTLVQSNQITGNDWNGLYADGYSPATDVKANTIDSNGESGMLLLSSSNKVCGNSLSHNNQYGIMIMQGDNNAVKGNQINWNGGAGVYILEGFWMDKSDYNTIIDNTANNNGYFGIIISGGDNNWIERNVANSNGYIGIEVGGGMWTWKSYFNTVTNNTANFNGGGGRGNGIVIVAADQTLVEKNQVNSNVGDGIYMLSADLNRVEHNEVSFNGGTGIFLEIAANNTIRWNEVHDNGADGMLLWRFSSYNWIQSNRFLNNIGSGIAINNPIWALWEGSVYNNISGNIVYYNGYAGLWVDSYSNYTTIDSNEIEHNLLGIYVLSNHNTITNNRVCNNIPLDGISIVEGDYNLVEDNLVDSNGGHGIFVKSTGTGTLNAEFNTIKRNIVNYNNRTGIFILAADNTRVELNRATWNVYHGIAVQSLMAYRPDNNTIIDNIALNNDSYGTGSWFDFYWDWDPLDIGNTWRDPPFYGTFDNTYGTIDPAVGNYT